MATMSEPSVYEVPGFKLQDRQEGTASVSARGDLTEQAASTFCEGNCQESQSGRRTAEKCPQNTRVSDQEQSTRCKVKCKGLRSGKGPPEKCSMGARVKDEDANPNVKAGNVPGPSIAGISDLDMPRPSPNGGPLPEGVIIIDDDEEEENDDDSELYTEEVTSDSEQDDDELTLESDARSSKNPRSNSCESMEQRSNPNTLSTTDSTNHSDDEDDCQMFEPGCKYPLKSLRSTKRFYRQRPLGGMSADCYRYVSLSIGSSGSDSSDCELMQGSYGEIREQWEEAALRKRVVQGFKRGQYEVEAAASASGSNLDPYSPLRVYEQDVVNERLDADFQGHYADGCSRDPPDVASASGINYTSGQADVTSSRNVKEFETENLSAPGIKTPHGVSTGQSTNTVEVQPSMGGNECNESSYRFGVKQFLPESVHPNSQQDENTCSRYTSEGAKMEFHMRENFNEWIGDREKLKETAAFRHAEQEEWAHRKLELQRQS
eukprot:Gb_24867 [translate_table: standard]